MAMDRLMRACSRNTAAPYKHNIKPYIKDQGQ